MKIFRWCPSNKCEKIRIIFWLNKNKLCKVKLWNSHILLAKLWMCSCLCTHWLNILYLSDICNQYTLEGTNTHQEPYMLPHSDIQDDMTLSKKKCGNALFLLIWNGSTLTHTPFFKCIPILIALNVHFLSIISYFSITSQICRCTFKK